MKWSTCLVTVWCVGIGGAGAVEPTADRAPLRLLRCPTSDGSVLESWQVASRTTLLTLLQIDDLAVGSPCDAAGRRAMPLHERTIDTRVRDEFTWHVVEIDARPDRRITVNVTIPRDARAGTCPAVICIHGHGGHRDVVYDETTVYHGFALPLARRGCVTLSTDVGQHDVQDAQRTLMGERLWDLMRVVDLAIMREEVDPRRIGCAGLSLGGEMAMWLGALDPRIAATVSSGFLTTMENMRVGHCMCWDFPGLQRRYEFADIYSLIAPRALQCQNGQQERLPGGFPVELAEQAMSEIRAAYCALGAEDAVELSIHPGGHEFDVAAALRFFDARLAK
jgi:pimeloyl-ACP methyl ester carboxylesterase